METAVGLKEPLVVINEDECKGCGLCVDICPKKVLFQQRHLNRMGYHPAGYIGEGCIGCGHCFYACPEPGAIAVYKKGYVVPNYKENE
ncbi:MAG: 4Fe-4S binding protein [candidate division KSB1 bacterium]|nr:4Fe-4S binding protein [candidate division KSB1 bacterium]